MKHSAEADAAARRQRATQLLLLLLLLLLLRPHTCCKDGDAGLRTPHGLSRWHRAHPPPRSPQPPWKRRGRGQDAARTPPWPRSDGVPLSSGRGTPVVRGAERRRQSREGEPGAEPTQAAGHERRSRLQQPLLAVLSCSRSISQLHNDAAPIRAPPPEERRPPACAQQPGDGRRANTPIAVTTEPDSAETECAQRPACWSDPRPAPPQLLYAPPRRRSPAELALSLGNGLTHAPLHSNNRSALQSRQWRGGPARVRQRKSRISGAKNSQNRKVTDFYPIRRSSRKSKTELKCEQKKQIDDLITNGIEEGMKIQHIEGKGRAVFATRCFLKGEYVVEYHGDLLEITDAKKREAEYAQNPETGCYMYYFQYLCKTYCVDATKETSRMGRLINHSKSGNCQTKLHDIGGVPHLILVASRDIDEGEELLYDYGDRSKASIAAHPWLKH